MLSCKVSMKAALSKHNNGTDGARADDFWSRTTTRLAHIFDIKLDKRLVFRICLCNPRNVGLKMVTLRVRDNLINARNDWIFKMRE